MLLMVELHNIHIRVLAAGFSGDRETGMTASLKDAFFRVVLRRGVGGGVVDASSHISFFFIGAAKEN